MLSLISDPQGITKFQNSNRFTFMPRPIHKCQKNRITVKSRWTVPLKYEFAIKANDQPLKGW
jgi:hypothetical protein